MNSIIKKILRALGIKTEADRNREKRINYSVKKHNLEKSIASMERKYENKRLEAIRKENEGKHKEALQAAMQAKTLKSTLENISAGKISMETAYSNQLITQDMKEAIAQITSISRDIIGEAGDLTNALADLEASQIELDNINENFATISETMMLEGGSEENNAVGEEALEELMKEEREKNIVLTESVIDEKTEDVPDDLQDRAAWTKAQMEKLNMMTPADM